jgi:hypothetical protein
MYYVAAPLTMLQLATMFAVCAYAPERRPLMLYTTSLTEHDAAAALESGSNVSLSPALPMSNASSTLTVYEVLVPMQFMLPALIGASHGFASARLIDNTQVALDAPYGEHGVSESLAWETGFWLFVAAQNALVTCVMCSPVNALSLVYTALVFTAIILAFCTLSVNTEGASLSRRLEGPAGMLLFLVCVLLGTQTRVDARLCLPVWIAYAMAHVLLAIGHLCDNPVSFKTVLNCRWAYVLLMCCLNIVLYYKY